MVCMGCPQEHSEMSVMTHLQRLPAVLPTLALASFWTRMSPFAAFAQGAGLLHCLLVITLSLFLDSVAVTWDVNTLNGHEAFPEF